MGVSGVSHGECVLASIYEEEDTKQKRLEKNCEKSEGSRMKGERRKEGRNTEGC